MKRADKLVKAFHKHLTQGQRGPKKRGGWGSKDNVLPRVDNPVKVLLGYIYDTYKGAISLESQYLCRIYFGPLLKSFVDQYNNRVGDDADLQIRIDFRLYDNAVIYVPIKHPNEPKGYEPVPFDDFLDLPLTLIGVNKNRDPSEQKGLIVSPSIADSTSFSKDHYRGPKGVQEIYTRVCSEFRDSDVRLNLTDILLPKDVVDGV